MINRYLIQFKERLCPSFEYSRTAALPNEHLTATPHEKFIASKNLRALLASRPWGSRPSAIWPSVGTL